ncbi:MAG: 7,8-didemethyl-8-hydroxy-5-deazariboflavin synthase subunit CofG [Candidatus Hodarchaeota archaeon]
MSSEKRNSEELQNMVKIVEKGIYDGLISFEEGKMLLNAQEEESKSLIRGGAFKKKMRFWAREITYSPSIFLPITKWCRNNCTYCAFRDITSPPYLGKARIEKSLRLAQKLKIREVLLTLGEKPEEQFPLARSWLQEHNYESTVEYLVDICELVLKRGLIPHTNAGVLTYNELVDLKSVNGSMGLMLETTADLSGLNQAHEFSPYKTPSKRLQFLKNAGKLKIPFTTGLLIGIGEGTADIIQSLEEIRQLYYQYRHIQEVIIQNFVPHPHTPFQNKPPPFTDFYLQVVAVARLILPGAISLQVPPNLNRGKEPLLLACGINDWGGISPVTPDYVNPSIETSWPEIENLTQITEKAGFILKKRWCVYPSYQEPPWVSANVKNIIKNRI